MKGHLEDLGHDLLGGAADPPAELGERGEVLLVERVPDDLDVELVEVRGLHALGHERPERRLLEHAVVELPGCAGDGQSTDFLEHAKRVAFWEKLEAARGQTRGERWVSAAFLMQGD